MLNLCLPIIGKAIGWMKIENENKATTLKYYNFVTLVLTAHVSLL